MRITLGKYSRFLWPQCFGSKCIITASAFTDLVLIRCELVHAASERGIHLSLRSTQDGKPDNMLRSITPEKSVILAVADSTSRKKDLSLLSEMLITRKADYLGMVEIVRG